MATYEVTYHPHLSPTKIEADDFGIDLYEHLVFWKNTEGGREEVARFSSFQFVIEASDA